MELMKEEIARIRAMDDATLATFLGAVLSVHDYLWADEKDHAADDSNDDDHHIHDDLTTIQKGIGASIDHAEQDEEGQWYFVKYDGGFAASYGPFPSRSAAIIAGGEL